MKADTTNQMVAEFDLAQELAGLSAETAQFDSLIAEKNKLPLLKDRLFSAMSRASIDDLSVSNVTQTKPFKRNKVANIAFVFDMSDGQKISIWFQNPDSTPSKLLPDDVMVSWKWMLNRRDVTAVLSPKNGENVQLPTLASRMMRLAAKNSTRFKRTQARKAKTEKALKEAEQAVSEKESYLEQLDEDIDELQSKIDEALKSKEVERVISNTNYPNLEALDEGSLKALELGDTASDKDNAKSLQKWLKQLQGKTIITNDNKEIRFSLKTTKHILNDVAVKKTIIADAVSHLVDVLKTGQFIGVQAPDKQRADFIAFHVYRKWIELSDKKIHVQVKVAQLADGYLAADGLDLLTYTIKDYEMDKQKEDSRKLSSSENDMYDNISNSAPTVIFKPSKQPLISSDNNHNTMLDSVQDARYPMLIEILAVKDKKGKFTLHANKDHNKQSRLSELDEETDRLTSQIDEAMKVQVANEPIALTGKEFGDYSDEYEDVKKLRSMVAEHLENLKGTFVHNTDLDREIEIRNSGNKKFLNKNYNPLKLKAISAIKDILKVAKAVKVDVNSTDEKERQNKITYTLNRPEIVGDSTF